MPRDVNGSYSLPSGSLVNSGDTILPSQHNPPLQDLASAITGSLSRDGLGGMRADFDAGGFKVKNMAQATMATDALRYDQFSNAIVFLPPIGSIIDYAGPTPPAGWAYPAGQIISRTIHSALFAVIGTTYGAGDGSTTFALPDLRGRIVAGRDDMDGTSAGRLNIGPSTTMGGAMGDQVHTLTVDQMPAHNHGVNDPGHNHGYTAVTGFGGIATGSGLGQSTLGTQGNTTGISIQNNGGGNSHPNVQPTLILNKIMRIF